MISSLFTRFSVVLSPLVLVLWALLVGSLAFGVAAATFSYAPVKVEVFGTTDQIVEIDQTIAAAELGLSIDFQLYELNRIQLVEAVLSKDLPANPSQSKSLALQRIQVLDGQTRKRMQQSAIGLAKAMQYGINHYPAIIFDGQVVIYGVTDLQTALAHYQAWRTGVKP